MAGDHKCPVCNATFTRPQHVARHMRSHTGDRPYKCQHCGDQFARSDLLSRHVNKCHSSEKPSGAPNNRRKGSTSATRATTSKQACDQCVIANLPCDGSNPCSKCISRKCRCTFIKFHRQTAPTGPGHPPPRLPSDRQANHNPTFSLDHILPSEEYLLSNPNNASITLPGLSGIPIYNNSSTIPPQSDFSFSTNSLYPPSDPHPSDPDYSARYRELLYRTGVINNTNQSSPATNHSQPPRYNLDPASTAPHDQARFSLSTATWGASAARQDHLDHNGFAYHPNNDNRPHSQHGYPLSLPQNFSASSDPYDFRYNRHDSIDDSDSASVSTSELGHSSDHSSFYDSPTISQGMSDNPSAHGDARKSDNRERLPSAFGRMSLDDPNVVAGITSDGIPFFSDHNGESFVGEDVLMNLGKVNVHDQLSSSSGGITAAGMTPREVEFRDLREFWKQYIRTPLTGPNSNGTSFPLATPTPNNVHGQLEVPKPPSGKKLARVASLPSVKTPPVSSDVGPAGHHCYVSNEGRNANNNPAVVNNHRSHLHSHMGPDDLQSYERAILARKTNINLNLPRKRHGTTSDAFYRSRANDPMIPTPLPITSSIPPILQRRPSFSVVEARSSSTSSESDSGDGNVRPSFKRLPSTTLEPTYSKRPLLSMSNGGEGTTGQTTALPTTISNSGSTSESHHSYPAQDRHRRMSVT